MGGCAGTARVLGAATQRNNIGTNPSPTVPQGCVREASAPRPPQVGAIVVNMQIMAAAHTEAARGGRKGRRNSVGASLGGLKWAVLTKEVS